MKHYVKALFTPMMAVTLLLITTTGFAAHPLPGQTGYRGQTFPATFPGIPLVSLIDGSPINLFDSATGQFRKPVNGKYKGLAPMGLANTCSQCHQQIVNYPDKNRHSTMAYEKILPSSGYGYGYDKSRPWMSGPGKFGKWSPAYNRQLGNMGSSGFVNDADFLKKVDLAAFEFTRECGFCHVGGGPARTNPIGFNPSSITNPFRWYMNFRGGFVLGSAHNDLDNPIRWNSLLWDRDTWATNPLRSDVVGPALNQRKVPLNAWDYYVDENNNVVQVKWGSWFEQGVLELDCLMCHFEGYSHLARNEQINSTVFMNAAPVGSTISSFDATNPDVLNAFDYDVRYVVADSNGNLYLNSTYTNNLTRFAKADNCVSCHMPINLQNEGQAQYGDIWKQYFYARNAIPSSDPTNPNPLLAANKKPAYLLKDYMMRGDMWRSGSDDVHAGLACSACHAQTGKSQAYDPTNATTTRQYMHSPGKGYDPLLTGAPELNDTVKYCEDCHIKLGDVNNDPLNKVDTFGAFEPTGAHARAGLLFNIVSTARKIKDNIGTEQVFKGNHLDVISCTACHINKRYAAARSFDFSTGGKFMNFVGNPLNVWGPYSSVPMAFTWKANLGGPTAKVKNGQPNPDWRRMIYPFNYVTGIYWNNVGTVDANGDGFVTGALNGGVTVVGDPFFGRDMKAFFNFNGVNANNNIVPTSLIAAGAPYNNPANWPIKTQDGSVMFTQAAAITAYQTLVAAQKPGWKPQLVLESEPYLLEHNVASVHGGYALGKTQVDSSGKVTQYGCSDCHAAGNSMYEGAYDMIGNGVDQFGSSTPVTISWAQPGGGATPADVVTKALYWDRTGAQSYLEFVTAPRTSTRVPTRNEFLGYTPADVTRLDAVTITTYGVGVGPVADIDTIGSSPALGGNSVITLTASNLPLTMTALDASQGHPKYVGNPYKYYWYWNDVPMPKDSNANYIWTSGVNYGPSVSKVFNKPGVWTVNLRIIDAQGLISTVSQNVTVVAPTVAITVTPTYDAVTNTTTFTLSGLPTQYTQIYIDFGDYYSGNVRVSGNPATYQFTHKYARAGSYPISVQVFNSGTVASTAALAYTRP